MRAAARLVRIATVSQSSEEHKPEAIANPPDLTVFYDGTCPLCRAEMGVYRNCTGADRIAFVDVADAPDGVVVPGLDKADALKRFHVRGADGIILSGAAGFAALWLTLPRWRWVGRFLLHPAVAPVAEIAYRGFLVVRPGLQWIARRVAPQS